MKQIRAACFVGLLVACVLFSGCNFIIKQEPTTTVTIKCTPTLATTENSTAGNYINQATLAGRRCATYVELLKTETYYTALAKAAQHNLTAEDIRGMLTFEHHEEDCYFLITVTAPESQATAVAHAISSQTTPYLNSFSNVELAYDIIGSK